MEKVLRKRAWRDLKENKFRYFALTFLIIISNGLSQPPTQLLLHWLNLF